MIARMPRTGLFVPLFLLSTLASAQVMSIPSSGFGNMGNSSMGVAAGSVGLGLISSEQMTNNMWGMQTNMHNQSLWDAASESVSKLDLKAPAKARHEYQKGYELLLRKQYQEAVDHLAKATEIYPSFVAAHNALGSAYLNLRQTDKAQEEFSQAVALDDHLPNSHLNLGVAQLALKNYAEAEKSLQKAASIAPLDTSLKQALAYGALANKDYPEVIETARQLHKHKHEGTAVVHYFAAGAYQSQNNLPQAQYELETLLREEPKFSEADRIRQLLQQLKEGKADQGEVKEEPTQSVNFEFSKPAQPTAQEASEQAQRVLQSVKEKSEIAEAEAANAEPRCPNCGVSVNGSTGDTSTSSVTAGIGSKVQGGVLRTSVDEVNVFFTATDHGKAVTTLTGSDFQIRDNRKAPEVIRGFRNETELPLRLGLVIDISNSVEQRFSFEQKAALEFLKKALVGKDDLAFIVGVNNSVLLAQDFTADQARMEHAVGQLVPSGGTALWDAVGFAAEKLTSLPDVTPVARVLVVISDGENNSSQTTLRDAIEQAQHAEVAVYTVSTRDYDTHDSSSIIGDHALQALAELTGGAAFEPTSIRWLHKSLAEVQQVLRGRYMVSYKPALFQRNGQYRPIDISAEKDGRKLKIYARKGYYASVHETEPVTR